MNPMHTQTHDEAGFELRFQSLFNEGRGLAFPCDARGHVDIDRLSGTLRLNYLYARTLIGREFSMPALLPRSLH
ncbi:hypothetical protein [uncultured Piscinibacter sp.]|uniref:hypothetical protein n=1 Tax=uncultured Piscinibacter sp. TaxID=1131835 RepID=UPI00263967A0|nr:hypothetical protein [uncultured Piscinibacter sp.]